jgi:hypothetical protein
MNLIHTPRAELDCREYVRSGQMPSTGMGELQLYIARYLEGYEYTTSRRVLESGISQMEQEC